MERLNDHSPHLALFCQVTVAAQDGREHSQSGVARFTLVVLHAEQPPHHQFNTLNLRHRGTLNSHPAASLIFPLVTVAIHFQCEHHKP